MIEVSLKKTPSHFWQSLKTIWNLQEAQEIQGYSAKNKSYDDLKKKNIKKSFLWDVMIELKSAVTIHDSIFLAWCIQYFC